MLDMSQCLKLRQFRPGSHVQGSISWTRGNTGEVVASIKYQANMCDPENAWLRLMYSATNDGETTAQDYRVEMTTTRPHFGGVRWWFLCPMSYRRVRCLYIVGRSERFACRKFLRLAYQVQRESWRDQRLRAARAADIRLGGTGNLFADSPDRPKWMRWPTYWRLVEERDRAVHRSLISMAAAFDDSDMQAGVHEALHDDPSLLAGSR